LIAKIFAELENFYGSLNSVTDLKLHLTERRVVAHGKSLIRRLRPYTRKSAGMIHSDCRILPGTLIQLCRIMFQDVYFSFVSFTFDLMWDTKLVREPLCYWRLGR
jgi:hypothetical protein